MGERSVGFFDRGVARRETAMGEVRRGAALPWFDGAVQGRGADNFDLIVADAFRTAKRPRLARSKPAPGKNYSARTGRVLGRGFELLEERRLWATVLGAEAAAAVSTMLPESPASTLPVFSLPEAPAPAVSAPLEQPANPSIFPRASLTGCVYVDLNGSGVRDVGEPGLQGVSLQLTASDSGMSFSTQTGVDGQFTLSELPTGQYRLHELQPAGYFDGGEMPLGGVATVLANDILSVTIVSPDLAVTGLHFGELAPGAIRGQAFETGVSAVVDKSGPVSGAGLVRVLESRSAFGAGAPASFATVVLADAGGVPLLDAAGHARTTRADSQGRYEFSTVPPGLYTVQVLNPPAGGDVVAQHGAAKTAPPMPPTTSQVANGVLSPVDPTAATPRMIVPPSSLRLTGDNGDAGTGLVIVPFGRLLQPSPVWVPLLVPPTSFYTRGRVPGLKSIDLRAWSQASQIAVGPGLDRFSILRRLDRRTMARLATPNAAEELLADFDGDRVADCAVWVNGLWRLDLSPREASPLDVDESSAEGLTVGFDVTDAGPKPAKRGDQAPADADATLTAAMEAGENADSAVVLPVEREPNAHAQGRFEDASSIDHGRAAPAREMPPDDELAAVRVLADFDGDGIEELAAYCAGKWYVDANHDSVLDDRDPVFTLGADGDLPFLADWNRDGVAELGVIEMAGRRHSLVR